MAAASTRWEVTAVTAMKVLKSVPLAQSVLVITTSWWVSSSLFLVAHDAFQVFQVSVERVVGASPLPLALLCPNHATMCWTGCWVIRGADTQILTLFPTVSIQTPARDSASPKCCKPCARCPPPTATWSPNPSAAATAGAAGAPSVSCVPSLELPSTRKCVLMGQVTPPMAEVSWEAAEMWVQAQFPWELVPTGSSSRRHRRVQGAAQPLQERPVHQQHRLLPLPLPAGLHRGHHGHGLCG